MCYFSILSFFYGSVLQRHQLSIYLIIFVCFKPNVFSLICFIHVFIFILFCLFLFFFLRPLLFCSSFCYSLCSFYCGLYVFVFFFLNGHTHGIWKFWSQGLNPGHSDDLCHSWGYARSFNPLHWAGDRNHASSAT